MDQQQERLVHLPPLDVGAVNLLLEGLGKLPLERSVLLFQAIQQEAQRQLAPTPPVAAADGAGEVQS